MIIEIVGYVGRGILSLSLLWLLNYYVKRHYDKLRDEDYAKAIRNSVSNKNYRRLRDAYSRHHGHKIARGTMYNRVQSWSDTPYRIVFDKVRGK